MNEKYTIESFSGCACNLKHIFYDNRKSQGVVQVTFHDKVLNFKITPQKCSPGPLQGIPFILFRLGASE